MSGDPQKIPLVIGLTRFAEDKVDDGIQMLGKSIPASVVSVDETGTIITVKFEIESDFFTVPQVECALATDIYTRAPIKKGDMGYVVPSDYYMGGVTGLGGGVANFEKQANLATLVFHPTGNTDLDKLYDKDRYVLFGPKGVILQNDDKSVKVTVGPIDDGLKNVMKLETLVAATNDADAASKGVPIKGLYQTSGAVKVRLS